MSYTLTITRKPAYLHAIVTGANNKKNVMAYIEELHRECIARGCFRVLVEERLEGGRVSTTDVFEIVSAGSDRAGARLEAVAYVDVNAAGDLMKFAETVAVNRGLPMRVFQSVADAEQWLQDTGPGSGEAGPGAPG